MKNIPSLLCAHFLAEYFRVAVLFLVCHDFRWLKSTTSLCAWQRHPRKLCTILFTLTIFHSLHVNGCVYRPNVGCRACNHLSILYYISRWSNSGFLFSFLFKCFRNSKIGRPYNRYSTRVVLSEFNDRLQKNRLQIQMRNK